MRFDSVPAMMDLYVYYKVRESDAAALARRVRTMQAALAREGVRTHLKRRPESKDGIQTWMEVYTSVGEAFQARLDDAAAQAGLSTLIAGPRRAEVFVDLPTVLDGESAPCA